MPQALNSAERRRFETLSKDAPVKRVMALTMEAHAIVKDRMEGTFNNVLSAAHNEALCRAVGLFSWIALGQKSGRYVIDLPTGCGKTQSLTAWIVAVHRLGLDTSVTIAASQVEELAKIIRDLEGLGVPREKIGLTHSKKYCPHRASAFLAGEKWNGKDDPLEDGRYATEPVTEGNENRPFLFVTHQRIRNATVDSHRECLFMDYKGKRRDLVMWDEAMYSTAPMAATMSDIRSGIGAIRPYLPEALPGDKLALAEEYLSICDKWIEEEWKRQCDNQAATELTLPALAEAEVEAFSAVIGNKLVTEGRQWSALQMLLAASGQKLELRLAKMGEAKGALISYRVTIPTSLKDLVILDASHVCSQLIALDKTIKRDEWFKEQADNGVYLKTYENVTAHFAKGNSGRSAMEDAFEKRKVNDFPAKLVETIKTIPDHEALIIFTFKNRSRKRVDMRAAILAELKKAGIDTAAQVDGKDRITVLTWGQHTSRNEYSHCSNILFAGVLHLQDELLLAHAVGQSGELLTPWMGASIFKTSSVAK